MCVFLCVRVCIHGCAFLMCVVWVYEREKNIVVRRDNSFIC